jgi:hypothetical protein
MNKHSEEISDEELANDRWENEGGHTEVAQHRKKRLAAVEQAGSLDFAQ